MNVLWCGGEDSSFPNGVAVTVTTSAGTFRSGYGRCAVSVDRNSGDGRLAKSTVFPGGAVSSCWLRFYCKWDIGAIFKVAGLGLSGTNKCLLIGQGSTANKMALWKYDGTTFTNLAEESAAGSIITGLSRIDVQLIGPLSAGTVNVYLNGTLVLTYTGDLTFSSTITNFDSVYLNSDYWPAAGVYAYASEFIVADEDTRSLPGLATLALTGAGTTDDWTGSTYSNINATTINDASPMYSNTNGQESQFNVTDLPTGTFAIKAVKIEARAAKSASPAVTKIQLGYNDGGSVAFGGSAVPVTTAYATYEQLDQQNPHGTTDWLQAVMNGLQVNVKAVT